MELLANQSMGYLIARTAQKMKNELAKNLKPYDVTPEQWTVLNKLWANDGVSQKDLAERIFKDQPTTARILDKLEQKGLVKRVPHPDDRRALLVFPTSDGLNIREKLVGAARQALDKGLEGFSEVQLDQLRLALNRICDNLDP